MLSYRHAFHAGNHADVLKHLVLVELLDYITGKDKALWYIDTHAGAGTYSLDQGPATELREFGDGIGRLWHAKGLAESAVRYVELVRRLNPGGALRRYPGSPWLARELLRPADRLWLCELHPADHDVLAEAFSRDRDRVRVVQRDGFAELRALLPPQPRRGLVLIDPPYELPDDYGRVIDAMTDALERFATGTYAIWYPMIRKREADRLPEQLARLGAPRWLDVRLTVRSRESGGLYGSGMWVVNPPYTLPAALDAALPGIASLLAQDRGAGFALDYRLP